MHTASEASFAALYSDLQVVKDVFRASTSAKQSLSAMLDGCKVVAATTVVGAAVVVVAATLVVVVTRAESDEVMFASHRV